MKTSKNGKRDKRENRGKGKTEIEEDRKRRIEDKLGKGKTKLN